MEVVAEMESVTIPPDYVNVRKSFMEIPVNVSNFWVSTEFW